MLTTALLVNNKVTFCTNKAIDPIDKCFLFPKELQPKNEEIWNANASTIHTLINPMIKTNSLL